MGPKLAGNPCLQSEKREPLVDRSWAGTGDSCKDTTQKLLPARIKACFVVVCSALCLGNSGYSRSLRIFI